MNLDINKSGWRRVKFGDVVRNANDTSRDMEASGINRIIAMEHMIPGELTLTRWGYTEDGSTFTRRVTPGQTLFGKRRAYQRKVAFADFEAFCSGDIYTFEGVDGQMLPEFLPFVVQSDAFFEHALGTSAGSLSPRTHWRDLKNFEFALPPLDEQRRVGDLLTALEGSRRHLREAGRAARLAASALVEDLMRASAAVRLADVATVRNGQTFPKKLQGRADGDIPFFKVSDLDAPGNERFLTSPGNWVSNDDLAALGASPLPAGTIVTARVGAAIRLERRRLLKAPALVDDNHLVISSTKTDPYFLWAVLSETALSESRNDGVVPSLNQKIVGAVKVPDASLAQAERVGSEYMGLRAIEEHVAQEIACLNELKTVIAASLFRET